MLFYVKIFANQPKECYLYLILGITVCEEKKYMSSEKKTYSVSGLSYTLPQLLWVIALILIGQFAMAICINMVPRIVPLKLKELGISSTLLVFIMATLGQILNMTLCPMVSFKSDRYRSKRWGRRVPFILFTLPPLCLSWAMLAMYKYEAALLGKCWRSAWWYSNSSTCSSVQYGTIYPMTLSRRNF